MGSNCSLMTAGMSLSRRRVSYSLAWSISSRNATTTRSSSFACFPFRLFSDACSYQLSVIGGSPAECTGSHSLRRLGGRGPRYNLSHQRGARCDRPHRSASTSCSRRAFTLFYRCYSTGRTIKLTPFARAIQGYRPASCKDLALEPIFYCGAVFPGQSGLQQGATVPKNDEEESHLCRSDAKGRDVGAEPARAE